MKHVADTGIPLQSHEQLEDFALYDLVERGSDLVADHQVRLSTERAGERYALLLAAGQFARKTIDELCAELDHVEEFADTTLLFPAPQSEIELQATTNEIGPAGAG